MRMQAWNLFRQNLYNAINGDRAKVSGVSSVVSPLPFFFSFFSVCVYLVFLTFAFSKSLFSCVFILQYVKER